MRPALVLVLVALPTVALAGCFKDWTVPPPPEEGALHELRFSGEDAMEDLRAQVLHPNGTVRYRVPGTPGNAYVAQYIENELAEAGWETDFQNWGARYICRDVPMRNVVGVREGATNRTVVLGAHYDTRPYADKDRAVANRTLPVPGANDGASGVAVLLELVREMAGRAPNLTIIAAFFDAEDGGDIACPDTGEDTGWILGSLRFIGWMRQNVPRAANVTEAVIIVDMVGDPDLVMRKEGLSALGPGRKLQDHIYATGAMLGHGAIFVEELGPKITDDHRAFLDPPAHIALGSVLPAVDLIHLDAGADPFPSTHHTRRDDLAHVSAASLEAVGRTVEHVLLDLDRMPRCGLVAKPSACNVEG